MVGMQARPKNKIAPPLALTGRDYGMDQLDWACSQFHRLGDSCGVNRETPTSAFACWGYHKLPPVSPIWLRPSRRWLCGSARCGMARLKMGHIQRAAGESPVPRPVVGMPPDLLPHPSDPLPLHNPRPPSASGVPDMYRMRRGGAGCVRICRIATARTCARCP